MSFLVNCTQSNVKICNSGALIVTNGGQLNQKICAQETEFTFACLVKNNSQLNYFKLSDIIFI